MAVSSVGLRLKCDCSGKAQTQFNSKLQTRFLVREDALKAEQRNCRTKEEKNKVWSRVAKGGPIPRLTGRLTVGRKKNSNSNSKEEQDKIWSRVPKGGPIPRLTGRLTVGRKTNSNSNSNLRQSQSTAVS
jgi:hypothetical protein